MQIESGKQILSREPHQAVKTAKVIHVKEGQVAAMGKGNAPKPKIRSMKKGGLVHKTGPHLLHKGEFVVPKDALEQQHKTWMMSDGGAMKR